MSSQTGYVRKGFALAGVACFVTALLLFLGPIWWWAIYGMTAHIGAGWFWTDVVLIPTLCIGGGWFLNEA